MLPFIILLLLLVTPSSSLFYVILEPYSSEQCFMVDQPQGTVVVVDYDFPNHDKQKIKLAGNLNAGAGGIRSIQEKTIIDESGTFKFSTVKDGLHSVCIVPEKLTKPTRIGIDISYGESERYYEDLAREAHIDQLEANIMKLNKQMSQVLNEADFMKDREVVFHQQCEKMNSAARWWPILQVAILLITGVLQVNNLKRFFKARRLV